jgi:hypothetical protein
MARWLPKHIGGSCTSSADVRRRVLRYPDKDEAVGALVLRPSLALATLADSWKGMKEAVAAVHPRDPTGNR